MPSLDIFDNDAFSMTSLAAAIEKVPYKPQYVSALGVFEDEPVRTESVFVEERDGTLSLVQTSERGAPLPQRKTEQRSARGFKTVRIAKGDRVTASAIQNIRAFGSETELMSVQAEVARRLSGPTGLQRDVELTWENQRLGAVQGVVTDADGTVLFNWFDEFGIAQPDQLAFDLTGANAAPETANAKGVLRPYIQKNVVRPMQRAAKGAFLPSTRICALCGDNFYDDLTNHGEVRATYLNWLQAQSLRESNAFEEFPFGGVTWVNYRGTDDATTVAIDTDDCALFPVGAPGLFKQAWSPGEFIPFIGTLGKPLYPLVIPDEKRQAYVDIELYSYPLFFCTRPEVLFSGRRGS